jgi:hypothetical protein
MLDSKASRFLKIALFTLVPAEYLSMFLSSPSFYGDSTLSRFLSVYLVQENYKGYPPSCFILLPMAFSVSLLSLNTHRIVAVLGILPMLITWAIPLLNAVTLGG